MRIKELLEDIKQTIKESSNKANRDMEELKSEVDTLKNKLNTQNSRLVTFFGKIDELKQSNLESATLIEEIAFSLLEEEQNNNISENKEILILKTSDEEKYIN